MAIYHIGQHMEHFTIGQGRTGKIITSHPDLDGLDSYAEIFDAMAMLSVLAIREIRRDKDTDIAVHLTKEATKLEETLKRDNQWQAQMNAINAHTSLDIRNYAIRLFHSEFKE